MIADNF